MNGVLFGEKHSFRDWGLYLKSRPEISSPSPKTVYIDLPGSDGQIDLTESLTGEVKYKNRTIKCEFTVVDARERWSDIYSEVMDYLHGQRVKIIFDEDPFYYYVGRAEINEWKSDKVTSTLVIEANVEPYKLELISSLEDWTWDDFNFNTGVIRDWKELQVDGKRTIVAVGTRKSVIPVITVKSDNGNGIKYSHKGSTIVSGIVLPDGVNRNPDIVYKAGETVVTLEGHGIVSIDYRGGKL